jgi:hypothetical protein
MGSRTVDARLDDGTTTHDVCAERWTIRVQSDASFSGAFESGGAPCPQLAGAIEGTITTTGAIATLSINATLGLATCVVSAQTALTGAFLAAAVNIRFSDEIVCASGGGTFRSTSRTIAVALTRQ